MATLRAQALDPILNFLLSQDWVDTIMGLVSSSSFSTHIPVQVSLMRTFLCLFSFEYQLVWVLEEIFVFWKTGRVYLASRDRHAWVKVTPHFNMVENDVDPDNDLGI